MALKDALPLFELKPVSLEAPVTKLVPKKSSEQPTYPTLVSDNKSILGTTQTTELPAEYKHYEPLMTTLNDSIIKSPKARAAVLTQMGLERGWKAPEDNNYGNITTGGAWKGASVKRGDKDAFGSPILQDFRVYDSTKQFVDDYISVLKNTYPKAYNELVSDDFDIDRFTSGLVDQKFKYATDPNYKTKVKGVYNNVISKIISK